MLFLCLACSIPIKQVYGVFYCQVVRMFNANFDNVKALIKSFATKGLIMQIFK